MHTNKVAIRCHASSFSSSEKLVVVSQRADSLCTASIKLVELLYGSETWTMRKVDSDRIQSFHMQALRRILGIDYQMV